MNKDLIPVLDEISAVLKKHDVTGIIVVGNRTHCDFRMHVTATWSCAVVVKEEGTDREMVKVRSKREDYPSREAQVEVINHTVGTFVTFSDILDRLNGNVKSLLVMISRHVQFIGRSTTEE